MDSLLDTYLALVKMTENDPRYDSMLFNYETSMKHAFRNAAILDVPRTVYKEKQKCLRPRPPPLKDIQTLTDWKRPNLPIDLMVMPKDIVRTEPSKIQEPYERPVDVEAERVRATRPRLVMTPAVSMDDIDDPHKRQILIKEIYLSSTKAATLHLQPDSLRAPLQGTLSPPNPITIQKLQFPFVSPEWRMRSVQWDGRQLRAHCDPSAEFYLARPLRCKICATTAAIQKDRKMKIMKRNM